EGNSWQLARRMNEMATATSSPATMVPMLVDGGLTTSKSTRASEVFNPSTGKVIAQVPLCSAEEVNQAVRAAADALPAWAETPAVDRARIMFRYREILQSRFE